MASRITAEFGGRCRKARKCMLLAQRLQTGDNLPPTLSAPPKGQEMTHVCNCDGPALFKDTSHTGRETRNDTCLYL